VGEHRGGEELDVVGDDVVPPVERRPGPRGPQQLQRGPRRRPEPQLGRGPGGRAQRDDVLLERPGDEHAPHGLDQRPDVVRGGDRLELVKRRRRPVRVEHLQFGGRGGVPDRDPRGEPVALRLGQRVRALHLDRVLRRDHHERPVQRVGGPVDRDLPLLHALEQGGLGLRRGPVDLVADDDVREDRPRLELELAQLLVVGADPGDVAGQQVGGELDAPHGTVDRPREGLGEHRLAHPGHVLDEQVPLGEQHDQGQPDRLRLAVDDRLDGGADLPRVRGQLTECLRTVRHATAAPRVEYQEPSSKRPGRAEYHRGAGDCFVV
jgi:hypothetical protein